MLMGSRPEFLVLCYAVALVGGINVLISTFSQDEDLDWILRHSDTALLIMHGNLEDTALPTSSLGGILT